MIKLKHKNMKHLSLFVSTLFLAATYVYGQPKDLVVTTLITFDAGSQELKNYSPAAIFRFDNSGGLDLNCMTIEGNDGKCIFRSIPLVAQITFDCRRFQGDQSNGSIIVSYSIDDDNWTQLPPKDLSGIGTGRSNQLIKIFDKKTSQSIGICDLKIQFTNCSNIAFDNIKIYSFEGDEIKFLRNQNKAEVELLRSQLLKTFDHNYLVFQKLRGLSTLADITTQAFSTANLANPIEYSIFNKAIESMENTVDKGSVMYQQILELKNSLKKESQDAGNPPGPGAVLAKGAQILANVGNIVLGGRLNGAIGLFKNLFGNVFSSQSLLTQAEGAYKVDKKNNIVPNEDALNTVKTKVTEAAEKYKELTKFLDEIQGLNSQVLQLKSQILFNYLSAESFLSQMESMFAKDFGLSAYQNLADQIGNYNITAANNPVRTVAKNFINSECDKLLEPDGGGKIFTEGESEKLSYLQNISAQKLYIHDEYLEVVSGFLRSIELWGGIISKNPFSQDGVGKPQTEWGAKVAPINIGLNRIKGVITNDFLNFQF